MDGLIHLPAEPVSASVSGLFEAAARHVPQATALIEHDRRVTYEALDQQANGVARALHERGLAAGDRVAVHIDVSVDTLACVLGVLKAGGIWVPVDSALPAARQRDILADCEPAMQVAARRHLTPPLSRAPLVRLSECPPTPDGVGADETSDICCILYTSGKTGQPKGVVISTVAIVNHLRWMQSSYPLAPDDVAMVYRPCSIVAAIWDHFGPLIQNTPSVVVHNTGVADPALILRQAIQHGASHISGSPSFWIGMLSQPHERLTEWRTLRLALTSGEQISVPLVRAWKSAFPTARLLNVYGATECVRPCAYDTTDLPDDAVRVPIGKPVPDVTVTVCDEESRPIADGEIGEICFTGPCVARGYLNLPELTQRRFVSSAHMTDTTFKSGDLGRRRPDGHLELTGRMDDLVKIRGYRVELEEIATRLRELEDVHEAAVVTYDHAGDVRLAAFLVFRDGQALPVSEIRRHLSERLPDYMIPGSFVTLGSLPLTRSGKVDRETLRQAATEQAAGVAPASTSTSIADRLAGIVAAALGVPAVDTDRNFLELGGHSLLAIQIVARVFDEFQVDLPLYVFLSPALTIQTLAAEIDALRRAAVPAAP